MLSLRSKIRWWAIYSRGFVLILQVLSNLAIPDLDSSDTFSWVRNHFPSFREEDEPTPVVVDGAGDHFISFFFDGLVRLDVNHYLHIANNGYTYENNLSFLPIYPLLVQSFANCANWFFKDLGLVHYVSLLKISGVYLNFVAFIITSDVFYSLSRRVLRDELLAYKATLLFCLNPASVLFSAPLAETFTALFTFASFLALEKGLGLWSGVFLSLTSATKATGLANVGFAIYKSMKTVATETILFVRAKKKLSTKKFSPEDKEKANATNVLIKITTHAMIPGMLNILLGLGSFAAFQWYSFTTFCRMTRDEIELSESVVMEAKAKGYILAGSGSNSTQWCSNDPPIAFLPTIEKYGDFGAFKSWDSSHQLPHLFAAPAIGLILWQFLLFVRANKKFSIRFGLVDNTTLGLSRAKDAPMTVSRSLPRPCFPYIVDAATKAIFGVIFLPVQDVTTILCSSSPVLYWFAALLTTRSEEELAPVEAVKDPNLADVKVALKVETSKNLETRHSTILFQGSNDSDASNWVKFYFLTYTLLGTVLFSNNYTWS